MYKSKVGGILLYECKVVIGKRTARKGVKLGGEWDLPRINIIEGENDIDALERMARISAGIKIDSFRYIISHKDGDFYTKWYECRAKSNRLKCGKMWDDAEWVDKSCVLDKISERVSSEWPEEIKRYLGREV